VSLVLTERDRFLLLYLWQNRYMVHRQVYARFWEGSDRKAKARRRIALLEKAGYLRCEENRYVRLLLETDRVLIYITKAGCAALVRHGDLPAKYINDYPVQSRQVAKLHTPARIHDLQVVDLRLALSRTLKVQSWFSDHELRLVRKELGQRNRIPDGVFQVDLNGVEREFVLENERERYYSQSFKAVLELLRRQHGQAFVLVVSETVIHRDNMVRWAKQGAWVDRPQQLLFGVYDAVATQGAAADWLSIDGPIQLDHPLKAGIRQ